jgi:hypothetical protein
MVRKTNYVWIICFFTLLVDGCQVAAVRSSGIHPLLERVLILEHLSSHLLLKVDDTMAGLEVKRKQTQNAILYLQSARTILIRLTGLGVDVESMELPGIETIVFNQRQLESKLSDIKKLIFQIRKGQGLLSRVRDLFESAARDLGDFV